MAIADQKTTVADFETFLAKHPDHLFELIHGEIVEKMVTEEHGIIVVNIATEIRIYLKSNPIGQVGVEIRHRNPDDDLNDRLPDISFRPIAASDIVKQGAVPTMPALAIEIKSPTDSYRQMRDKAQYYLDNGTQLVWLIYPEKQLVEVYRKDSDIDILTHDDSLLGYDVLPNFELPVSEIFP
jgi:Uma2 family endonuclease